MLKITEVLLIDDDKDEHYFIKEAFKQVDSTVNVISVYNGCQGIEYLSKAANCSYGGSQLPHLIISDMRMPLMDGPQFLKEIKLIPQFAEIPCFLLSSSMDDDVKQQCLCSGAMDVYTKPMHLSDFKTILRDILFHAAIRIKGPELVTRNIA